MHHNINQLKEICFLNSVEYPEFPSNSYKKMMNQLGINSENMSIPWEFIIPKNEFEKENNVFIEKLELIKKDLNYNYYNNVYSKTNNVFNFLGKAKINEENYINHLEVNDGNSLLNSFEYDKKGFCKQIPKYSITDSSTGRMIIKSGPKILNLEKKYRNILESRFGEDGKLWYLDFISLEPRVLLSINSYNLLSIGHPPQDEKDLAKDIYEFTLKKTKLSSVLTREIVKKIILWQCYGMKKESILHVLTENNITHPEDVFDIIEEFYGIKNIKDSILKNMTKKDNVNIIENFYGRKIKLDSDEMYKLINYFIQSTAVDVALLGFHKMLETINKIKGANNFIIPIFILHDAIIFDVHNKLEHVVPKLCEIGSKNIYNLEETKFWIKGELFENTYKIQ